MRETGESCGENQASFRVTAVDGEGRRTSLLCAECGVGRGVPRDELGGGRLDTREIWDEIVQRLAGKEHESQDLACPVSRLTYRAFEERGSLGCPACYGTFQGDITRMLREYHGAEEHRGKMPRLHGRRIDLRRRMLGVKQRIQIAVSEERFEDAARMRDEMRDLDLELSRLQQGEAGS